METNYITLTKENIANEHICCAFSDKKCKDSYELKKEWLKKEFDNGYVFRRIDERAKVFIEYGPAEKAWVPVNAPNYLMINCFWVSGKYKGCGHGKALLQSAIDDAKLQGKDGLVTTKAAGRKRKILVGDTVAYDKLALLEAFMLTIPGVPCIYQGDEYGVPGANDPDNRRMMQFDNYSVREQQHLDKVKKLIKLRRSSLPLIYGDMLSLFCDKDVMAFARIYMGEIVVVAYNRSSQVREIKFTLPETLYSGNLHTNFGSDYSLDKNRFNLTLPPYGFEVLND